jgi:acetyltransferase
MSPRSIAVVGASPQTNSVGRHIVANIKGGGFARRVHVVNPHYGEIEGITAVKTLAAIPDTPDVVIVAAPPTAFPETVAEAARKGAAAAVITTPELERGRGPLLEVMEGPARIAGLRVVGAGCPKGRLLPPTRIHRQSLKTLSHRPQLPRSGWLDLTMNM